MNHYTLNSGHTRPSPRAEVRDDVIARMATLLTVGDHDLGEIHQDHSGWRLVVPETPAGWLGTLHRGQSPVLTVGVAASADDEEAIWPGLEALYLKVTELPVLRIGNFAAPHRPELPWLAVVLVDPKSVPVQWAGDLERILAWAWLESRP